MSVLTREEAQQVLNIMESTHFAVADNVKHSVVMEHVAAIELLRARLAEKEPEPVVWMYQDKSTNEVRFQKHMRDFVDHGQTYETPLYAREWLKELPDKIASIRQPESETVVPLSEYKKLQALVSAQGIRLMEYESNPEVEQVAWRHTLGGDVQLNTLPPKYYGDHWKSEPLYTTPPQREWQGLSDEELIDAADAAPYHTMVTAGDYIYILARAIEAKLKEKNK